MNTDRQWVYSYNDGDGSDKQLLGGKGANLCEMTQMGLRVPPGFVISTAACIDYLNSAENALPGDLMGQVRQHIEQLEQATGKGFGNPDNPLLVSIRSGSAMSMPGMMDTILNLGLNAQTLDGLIALTDNLRFGYDAWRRFVQLFGEIALDIPGHYFSNPFEALKKRVGATSDLALSAAELKAAGEVFLGVVKEHSGRPFPEDVHEQLELAIKAVFDSWNGKRAIAYRKQFNITPAMANGTAVNVVTMVYGNMGNDCATGVGFTRNPGTGENVMFGEYLTNAQGEDVVAGIRTPKPVAELATEMPAQYAELEQLRQALEGHYHEVQDFEYTIEKGVLYCLQTRNGKMNATAHVRSSVEMLNEGLINREQALLRVDPEELEQLLHPRLDPGHQIDPLAIGLPASPGAAAGKVVFDADRAELLAKAGEKLILLREETKPEDIHGFFAAEGILTSRGGKTSHAAVVARGMGKPCVAGAEGIQVDTEKRIAHVGDTLIHEGDTLTIDGSTGKVYQGLIPTLPPEFSDHLRTLLRWADEVADLKVMANADTAEGAARARNYGAQGIGLCRTERMFNASERLPLVVEMILADTSQARKAALQNLLPVQRGDFRELFVAMSPHPVTIRLLDPPIHEFLPSERQLETELKHLHQLKATVSGVRDLNATMRLLHNANNATPEALPAPFDGSGVELVDEAIAKKELMLHKVRELYEVNPMLGHRGVRLGLTFPEIYAMQIRAVLEAAALCKKEQLEVHPEIMVPQVCTAEELRLVKLQVDDIRAAVESEYNVELDFHFGSMIEVVRACMRSRQLAEVAEFFSFGTNDLTQATFSFSREDAENKFLPFYTDNNILQDNPFEVLDEKGVGALMELTVDWGRKTRPGLRVGICGEQGGHPASIRFCHQIRLSYVSCSAPRVPVARLAAAHAKLKPAQ